MADSAVVVTAGTGTNIDTRTEGTNGNHRQVVVLGDPSTNAGVAPVDATAGLKVDLGADNDVTVAGVSTAAKQDTIIGHVDGIETSLNSIDGKITAVNTGAVVVSSSALPTGAATAAKQPALGTAGTASADVITVQGIASMTALKVDGSAVTQPVSLTSTTVTGTVAVTQSGTWDEVGINDSGNSITVDNGGTFVVQENGAALTSLQLIDDTVYTDGTGTPSKAIGVAGTDGTNPQILKTDTSGELQVDVLTMPTVTVTATNLDVQSGGADLATSSQGAAIQTAVEIIDNAISGNEMQVDVVGALPAGTNAIGKLAANSGVDIGDVDVTSLTGSTVAHDAADSGSPHKIGYKAYSPDGTTPGTAVAEGDRTDAKSDLDGRQLISDEHPRWWSYHLDTSTAQTDTSVQAAPGAGFQIVITNIIVSTGAATAMNFFLEEGASKIFGPIYLEAVAGRGFCTPAGFKKHITANTAVTITTSASIAQAIEIQGYIQAI